MILGTTGVFATGTNEDKVATRNAYRYNDSFIFVENGITFSVYPDGEFDFYIDNRISGSRNGVTFNSGFDYSPYAQYDDYGAVIQVENVPIFYDFYGRVEQIGDVNINYRNGRVRRVGGMYVYYNNRGFYDYHTGYINIYNRNYVYRPFHRWFARPALGFCLVLNRPYRRFYSPIRYTYYNPYRNNFRRAYVQIGREHRYNQVHRERANIYRNDRRVAVRGNSFRSNRSVAKRGNNYKTNRSVSKRGDVSRTGRSVASNNTVRSNRNNNVGRTSTVKRSTTTVKRGNNSSVRGNNSSVRGNNSSVRGNKGRTVTKREVTRTPRSTTVKRTATTYKKPTNRNTNVRSSQGRTQRAVANTRTQRSSVSKKATSTPSRSRSTVSRSTSSRSVSKAPSRSSRSNSRSATTRSSRRQ
jgi:hypothetical protein